MPVHDFINETTGEITTVYVPIGEPPSSHQAQVVDGRTLKRLYEAPRMAISTAAGDMTAEDFRRVTEGKKMTVGEMYDASKEMSEARAARNGGVDPVKQAAYDKFQRDNGYDHPDVGKVKQRQKLREATGIIIED